MGKTNFLFAALLFINSSLATAANFMHYTQGEKLIRVKSEPLNMTIDEDPIFEIITQLRAFSTREDKNKFFVTTAALLENNENFLIEINDNFIRASFYFPSTIKVADINDEGMFIIDITNSSNFVITCTNNALCESEIYTHIAHDGLWEKISNPAEDLILKYKNKFIGLFFE